jgi:hypothetical protein
MAYTHVEVSRVLRQTANRIAQLQTQVNTATPDLKQPVIVDGIPCSPELAQFANALRKTNRHLKFGISGKSKYQWSYETHLELHMYMEGDMYVLASIGHANYSVGKGLLAPYKFMVKSRTIQNEKYKTGRDEYNMALTDTLDRAVKNANKYIRRYSPLEVATISYDNIEHKLRSPGITANEKLYTAKRNVINHSHLQTELITLLETGYSFLSYDLRDDIIQLRDAQKEHTEAMSMAKSCYFITVRLQSDDMVCDVLRLHNHKNINDGTDPAVVYKMEDLPEELAGKIAVLSMLDDNQYVDNVGLRVNSSTFWVHA